MNQLNTKNTKPVYLYTWTRDYMYIALLSVLITYFLNRYNIYSKYSLECARFRRKNKK